MQCASCHTENSDDSRFCKSCGRSLPAATADTDRAPAPSQVDERFRTLLPASYESRTGPGVLSWISLALAGAALMFLGGLFVLTLQRREPASTVVLPPGFHGPQDPGAASEAAKSPSTPANSQSSAAAPTTETPGGMPYYSGFSFPPQIIVEPVQAPQTQHTPSTYASSVMPVQMRSTGRPSKPGKLLLPGDDEGPGSDIRIKVSDSKHGDGSHETRQPVINVTPASPNGDSSPAPSSHDARSYMAMGDTQRVSGEFDRAIASYKQALTGAGDDEGYAYQQIAACYQKQGNKDSAVTNYKNAISSYRHLIDSGRNVEDAKAGIRACESSIKTCNF